MQKMQCKDYDFTFGGIPVIWSSPQYQVGLSFDLWAFSSMEIIRYSPSVLHIANWPSSSSRIHTLLLISSSISGMNLFCLSSTTSGRSWPSTYSPFLYSLTCVDMGHQFFWLWQDTNTDTKNYWRNSGGTLQQKFNLIDFWRLAFFQFHFWYIFGD